MSHRLVEEKEFHKKDECEDLRSRAGGKLAPNDTKERKKSVSLVGKGKEKAQQRTRIAACYRKGGSAKREDREPSGKGFEIKNLGPHYGLERKEESRGGDGHSPMKHRRNSWWAIASGKCEVVN